MAELDAFGRAEKNMIFDGLTLAPDGSSVLALHDAKYSPTLRLTQAETAKLRARLVIPSPPTPTPNPTPAPAGVIWSADGSIAGPMNDPFLEWTAASGPGCMNGRHDTINLVRRTDLAHGGVPAPLGGYWYRHELKWWGLDTAVSLYGDRLELGNEKFGGTGSPNSQGWPSNVSEWKEGFEGWCAFAYLIPRESVPGMGTLPYEVKWSENYYGSIPICQFHGAGSAPPTFGAQILGTRERRKNEGPVIVPAIEAVSAGGDSLWIETLRPDTLYKFLYHFKISADPSIGFVESWGDNDDGTGFSKYGKRTYQTLNSAFMFPCQGGPRNEMTHPTNSEIPPTIVSYHAGWTFAKDRASAALAAFGAVL